MAHRTQVVVLPTKQDVARRAAEMFVRAAHDAVEEKGVFTVALSGGSTPVGMYEELTSGNNADRVEWERVIFFWSDERCVPPDDPESNYGAAERALLSKLTIPEANVHRMRGEIAPDEAAEEYEDAVRQWVPEEPPRFDLIYLGMGVDGHTASLFPHTDAVGVTDRLVVANHVPKLNADRISFTSTLINAAAQVVVLVTGSEKAPALKQVLEGERAPEEYPAQLIHPTNGTALWLVDSDAARDLTSER